jgi:hypothetical protein
MCRYQPVLLFTGHYLKDGIIGWETYRRMSMNTDVSHVPKPVSGFS